MLAVPVAALLAAPPVNAWPLAFVMLVPLFRLAFDETVSWRRLSLAAVGIGLLFALIGAHSIFVDVERPWLSELPATTLWVLTGAVALVLGAGLALCWVAGAWLTRRLGRSDSMLTALLGAGVWVSLSMLAALGLSTFGASMIFAYTLSPTTVFGQLASVGGVWLVSFGLVLVNWLWARSTLTSKRWWLPPLSVVVVLALWALLGGGVGQWSQGLNQSAESIRAVAIQRSRSSKTDYGDALAYDQALIKAEQTSTDRTLAVAPEVSYAIDPELAQRMTFRPMQLVYTSLPTLLAATQQKLTDSVTFVAGFVDTSDQNGWRNGAAAISRDGHFSTTYKRQLMPLGEVLPLRSWWPEKLQARYRYVPSSQFNRLTTPLGIIGTSFCNEVFAPGLARVDTRAGASLIAVLSSDFDVATPLYSQWQVRAAQYRAVETGRAVVLAADQAQSAIIDSTGSLVAIAAYKSTGSIEGRVSLRTDQTPWVRWASLWSALFAVALLTAGVLTVRQPKVAQ